MKGEKGSWSLDWSLAGPCGLTSCFIYYYHIYRIMISILYFIFVDNGLTDPKNYIWYSSYLHLIRSDSLSEIHLCYKKGKKISKLWNYELTCLTTYILIVCRMVLITGFYQILDSAFQICGNLTVSLNQEKKRFILLWFSLIFTSLMMKAFSSGETNTGVF